MSGLANLRYKRGEFEQTRGVLNQFHRAVEPTPESLWLAIRVERNLGDRAAENGFSEQLRRRFPSSPEYQRLLKGQYD